MKKIMLETKIEALEQMLTRLRAIETNCGQCDHFMNGVCHKFNAKPPPEVIESGCDEWEWNGMPF